MRNRYRLLMGAMALLYFGPLLAGLAGMGWSGVPVFVAVSALWLVVMRPGQWPRDPALWTAGIALSAAAQLSVNAVLVIVLFAIGRGVGGVAGFLPNIPESLPVAVSFLSIALSRLTWNPAFGDATDHFISETVETIQSEDTYRRTDEMVATLLSLPGDSDPDLTADALEAALTGPLAQRRLAALCAALKPENDDHPALRQALVLWATAPGRNVQEGLKDAQSVTFWAAASSPALLHLFATRALQVLQREPRLWFAFPAARDISGQINRNHGDPLNEALSALADRLHELTPPRERRS